MALQSLTMALPIIAVRYTTVVRPCAIDKSAMLTSVLPSWSRTVTTAKNHQPSDLENAAPLFRSAPSMAAYPDHLTE